MTVNPIVEVYNTPYKDSILIKGKMIILYVVTFDHGDTSGVILWTCYFFARSPQRSVVRQRTKRVMPKRLVWTSLGGLLGNIGKTDFLDGSKKSPPGPTERTPEPEYLRAVFSNLRKGVRWDLVSFNFLMELLKKIAVISFPFVYIWLPAINATERLSGTMEVLYALEDEFFSSHNMVSLPFHDIGRKNTSPKWR